MNDEALADLKARVRVAELRTDILDAMPVVGAQIHHDYWVDAMEHVILVAGAEVVGVDAPKKAIVAAGADVFIDEYQRMNVETVRQHLDDFASKYPLVTERKSVRRR